MKKLITSIAIVAALAVSFVAPVTVSAQTANCVNPGPYGICPPNTDITLGGVTIDDQALTLMIAGFVVGGLLIVNGMFIKHKLLIDRSPVAREV
jgi:uncharacterized membrane protein YjgN (DUF898 family)